MDPQNQKPNPIIPGMIPQSPAPTVPIPVAPPVTNIPAPLANTVAAQTTSEAVPQKKYSINLEPAPAFEGMPTEKEVAAQTGHKIFPKAPEKTSSEIRLRGYAFIEPAKPKEEASKEPIRLPRQGENSTGTIDPYRELPELPKKITLPLGVSTDTGPKTAPREKFERVVETPPVIETASAPRLRTFEGDAAEAIKNQNSSLLKIALAEQKRKGNDGMKNEEPSGPRRSFLGLSATLLVLGAGILVGVYFFVFHKATAPIAQDVATQVITVETQKEIPVTGTDDVAVSGKLKDEEALAVPQGTIKKIVFTETAAGQKKNLSTQDLFVLFTLRAPAATVRALGSDYIMGVYGDKNPEPFIILNPTSFETVFPGMLDWENTMYADLGNIFFNETALTVAPAATATSTATTSTSTPPIPTIQPKFEDVVIKNNNVRVLKDSSGQPVLYYSFPDKNHLVITPSEAALEEIFTRLTTAAKIVR